MSTENSSTATTTGPFVTDFAVGSNTNPWLYSFVGSSSTVKAAIKTIRHETGHSGQRTVMELENLRSKSSAGSQTYKIYDKFLAGLDNQTLIDTGSQSKILNFIAALDPGKQIRQYHRNTGEYIEAITLADNRSGIERIERLGFTEGKQDRIVFDFSDI